MTPRAATGRVVDDKARHRVLARVGFAAAIARGSSLPAEERLALIAEVLESALPDLEPPMLAGPFALIAALRAESEVER